ncbi:hypothetical protein A33M_1449 [Rhodovulum sp. PH10]|uniref:DUF2076 domain-containing protein n=1 Tax=Rhodovulum sp. PH10 TaxID=1187851 RepID=UPI00027C2AFB|nr:DUF2076 domain-containing protein [Rhodovulum sp. PH10]EJW12887.1 hypothetical protein A33M_1449 [Rhodovulum sp. PH10]
MTPQEKTLVAALFDRLATLEREPRDPDAEQAIRDGLGRAPHAVYALVQTALLQDEALRRAHERIAELEAGHAEERAPQGGFLDSLRSAMFGEGDAPRGRGSVPSVRAADPHDDRDPPSDPRWHDSRWGGAGQPAGQSPGQSSGQPVFGRRADPGFSQGEVPPAGYGQGGFGQGGYGQGGYGQGGYAQGAAPGAFGGGGRGSFLGTAAAAAAGVIGGSLLLDSLRGMTGTAHAGDAAGGATGHGALDPGAAAAASPWGGSGGGGDLARDAGLGDIGVDRHAALDDPDTDDSDDADYDDGGDFGDSDSDLA